MHDLSVPLLVERGGQKLQLPSGELSLFSLGKKFGGQTG